MSLDRTKELRIRQTDAERKIWSRLRNKQLGWKFRRQHQIDGYEVDFACTERGLVVELDGGQHLDQQEYDARRTTTIQSRGFRVIRFWNDDALQRTDEVLNEILRQLEMFPPHPSPLPPLRRGRGGSLQQLERASPPEWRPTASVDMLRLRARLYALIRAFFSERGVLEVETPVLSSAGNTDPNIESFHLEYGTARGASGRTHYLRTSPEFALKRLLAADVGDCYELGRVFRNGEAGRRHNPEFTMLEWYRVGWDHHRLMDEVAILVREALALVGRAVATRKLSYRELFLEHVDIDPHAASDASLAQALESHDVRADGLDRDDWLNLILTHRIEPQLRDDVLLLVHDFPASQAALARIREGEPPLAERFEALLGRSELANGYHELRDAKEQRERFASENRRRVARGQHPVPLDERLLQALHAGLPDCAGVAMGVDRLLMAMTGSEDLAGVIAFPFDRA